MYTRGTTNNSFPTLLAFAGVFDGHNGSKVAEYCAQGVLRHILREAAAKNRGNSKATIQPVRKRHFSHSKTTIDSTQGGNYCLKKAIKGLDPLEATYVKPFHHAQDQFGSGLAPHKTN